MVFCSAGFWMMVFLGFLASPNFDLVSILIFYEDIDDDAQPALISHHSLTQELELLLVLLILGVVVLAVVGAHRPTLQKGGLCLIY